MKFNVALEEQVIFLRLKNQELFLILYRLQRELAEVFPIGACLLTKKISVGMTPGTHGSTFGGNPLAMAVGNGVLDIILQDGFLDNVKKISKYFDQELIGLKKKYSKVILEVRGRGLLKGLKLAVDNTKFIETLMKYKMLVVKAEETGDKIISSINCFKKRN